MRAKILSFFLVLIFNSQLSALELKGPLIQGGLIMGITKPGSIVKVDGRKLNTLPNGSFVFGVSHDAASIIRLEVRQKNGRVEKRFLKIKKRFYRVQSITGLPKRKVTPEKRDFNRIKQERDLLINARRLITLADDFREGFIWPVHGRISGVYGSQRILNGKRRAPHLGIDIAAPLGTQVSAAASGTVTLVHQGMFFAGKTIFIDHGLGVGTIYIHLDKIVVDEGQKVRKGQIIGQVGRTGRATGPHLHWGLNWKAIRLDPSLLVGPMPIKKEKNFINQSSGHLR